MSAIFPLYLYELVLSLWFYITTFLSHSLSIFFLLIQPHIQTHRQTYSIHTHTLLPKLIKIIYFIVSNVCNAVVENIYLIFCFISSILSVKWMNEWVSEWVFMCLWFFISAMMIKLQTCNVYRIHTAIINVMCFIFYYSHQNLPVVFQKKKIIIIKICMNILYIYIT